MDPKFRIGKSIHVSYTRKDIMDNYYPDLWDKAEMVADKLANLQEKVTGLLPEAKKLLPNSAEALKEEKAQADFLSYIRLRALYAFAEELWKVIEEQSRNLAEAHDKDNHYDKEDAEAALEKTLNIAATIPFDDLINNQKYGLLELYEIKQRLAFECEVLAIRPIKVLDPYGMLSDIVGAIRLGNLMSEYWLRLAIDDKCPTNPDIGKLLDDDK